MTFRSHNSRSGFSLVEIAMVLAVAGIIMAGTLATSTKGTDLARINETNRRIAKITEALKEFDYGKLYLPCPGNASLARSHTNFGRDLDATDPSGARACTGSFNLSTTNIVAGSVPVRTLQLPDEYAFDAWGRRLTYVVDTRAAGASTYTASGDAFTIKDDTAGTALTFEADHPPVAIVLSLGKNGHGAFPSGGSSAAARINAASTSANERENSHLAANGEAAFNATFIKALQSSTFDDLMAFYLKQPKTEEAEGPACVATVNHTTAPSYTTDGGATWQTISGIPTADILDNVQYDEVSRRWLITTRYSDKIYASADLTTWTTITTGAGGDVNNLTVNGAAGASRLWLAPGWDVASSPDLAAWANVGSTGLSGGSAIRHASYGPYGAAGGTWVGVGGDMGIYTSTNGGANWTQRKAPSGDQFWWGAAVNNGLPGGDNLWVVGSFVNGNIWTSPDGITWTQRAHPINDIQGIAFNGKSGSYGLYMAVSRNNEIMTSPDGVTWTLATSPYTEGYDTVTYLPADEVWMVTVASNGDTTAKTFTSADDGVTWTEKGGISVAQDHTPVNRIACEPPPPETVCIANTTVNGKAYYTTNDGATWTEIAGISSARNYSRASYHAPSGTWMLTGGNNGDMSAGDAYYSTDLSTWTIGHPLAQSRQRGLANNGLSGASQLWVMTSEGFIHTSPTGVDGDWTQSPDTMGDLIFDIQYGPYGKTGGLWVAVGENGRLNTSSDGIDWTNRTDNLGADDIASVAHNGQTGAAGMWVAIDSTGQIASSPDGITWTARTSNLVVDQWANVVHNQKSGAAGRWVAVSGTSASTSTNGTVWTAQAPPFTVAVDVLTYNGETETFLAVDEDGQAFTTPDGVTWTAMGVIPGLSGGGEYVEKVTCGTPLETNWVAVGAQGKLATSTDGESWTLRETPISATTEIRDVAYNGEDLWVAVADGGKIVTSKNGADWTERTSGVTWDLNSVEHNLLSGSNGKWLAGGDDNNCLTSPDGITWTTTAACHNANGILAVAHNHLSGASGKWNLGTYWWSPMSGSGDAVTFADTSAALESDQEGICYNDQVGSEARWLLVGSDKNEVWTSPDGSTWTSRTVPTTTQNIYGCAYGNGRWTIVGDADYMATSTDNGATWTQLAASAGPTYDIAHNGKSNESGNSKWVAAGKSGFLWTSVDGVGWTDRSGTFQTDANPSNNDINSVAYKRSPPVNWVAVAQAGKLAVSADGENWTLRDAGFGSSDVSGVDYDGAGLWVAVGDGGKIATSDDGYNWAQVTSGTTGDFKDVKHNHLSGAAGLWVALQTDATYTSTDGITWTQSASGFGGHWYWGLAHNGLNGDKGLWLALSSTTGRYMSSPDAITWTVRSTGGTTGLIAAHYNSRDDYWLAVGEDHEIMKSANGILWSTANAATAGGWGQGVYFSNGLWVSLQQGAPTIMTSPDGVTWTSRVSPIGGTMQGLAGNGKLGSDGKWVIGSAAGSLATSADGVTWTAVASSPLTGSQVLSIAYKRKAVPPDGDWIVGGSGTTLEHSADTVSWTNHTVPGFTGDVNVIANNGQPGSGRLYVAVGDGNDLATSPDGLIWTKRTLALGSTHLEGVAHNQQFGSAGLWTIVGFEGKLATSPDGITWTTRTSSFGATTINHVAHNGQSGGSGLWVAVGDSGKLASSPDGVTWTQRTSSFGASHIYGVAHNGQSGGSGLWVAVSKNGKIATSTDGITWTQRTSSFSSGDTVGRVAHNHLSGADGLWVVVALGGKLATSTDGVTWTSRNGGMTNDLYAVYHNHRSGNDGLWAIGDDQGYFYTSPDGAAWTNRGKVHDGMIFTIHHRDINWTAPGWTAVGRGEQISHSSDGMLWETYQSPANGWTGTNGIQSIAHNGQVGANSQYVITDWSGKLATSPDAVTWTMRTSSFGTTAITWADHNHQAGANGSWVAVGGSGKLASSPDGITWTQRTSSFGATTINRVAHNEQPGADGLWVAVGESGKLASSTDGITWTQRTSSFGASAIYNVAHNRQSGADGLWVAVGESGKLATSADGITWTQRTSGYGTTIQSIAHNGLPDTDGLWIAGGFGTNVIASSDGITWTSVATLAGAHIQAISHNGLRGSSGLWVASNDSRLFSSPDGTTWTDRGNVLPLNFVYGIVFPRMQAKWVATGYEGSVATSQDDGETWKLSESAKEVFESSQVVGVQYFNGRWAAVSNWGHLASSEDGFHWTLRADIGNASDVTHNGLTTGGLWAAYSENGVYTSSDGLTWTQVENSHWSGGTVTGGGFGVGGIASNGLSGASEKWVVTTQQKIDYSTDDGDTWTHVDMTGYWNPGMGGLCHNHLSGGSGIWITGFDNFTYSSPDGVTWTQRDTKNLFGCDYANSAFFASSPGRFGKSADGITWTWDNSAMWQFANLNAIGHNHESGADSVALMAGHDNDDRLFRTLDDGTTWTDLSDTLPYVIDDMNVQDLAYKHDIPIPVDNSEVKWVAVADDGKLATSPDGDTWTLRDAGFGTSAIVDVAYNGVNLWTAVSVGGKIATSPDGITWTQRTSGTTDNLNSVEHNRLSGSAGLWAALGQNCSVFTSPDGITWTQRNGSSGDWCGRIAHNGLAGASGLWLVGTTSTSYITSPNATTWTWRTAGTVGHPQAFYNTAGGYWLMIGDGREIIKSSTGIGGWSTVRANACCYWGYGLYYANGLWVGVAEGTAGYPSIVTSPDSTTWTTRAPANANAYFASVASNEQNGAASKWIAAGDVMETSSNGTTWTTVTTPFGGSFISRVAYKRSAAAACVMTTPTAGKVYYTTDGAATWTLVGGINSSVYRGVRYYAPRGEFYIYGDLTVASDYYYASASSLGTWTGVNVGSLNYNRQMAHNGLSGANERWQMCDTGTNKYTSSDGRTWTARGSGLGELYYTYGPHGSTGGIWMAVDESSTNDAYSSSDDGATWTSRNVQFGTDALWGVTHNNLTGSEGLWVAYGGNGKLSTSPDGITWTARTSQFGASTIYRVNHNGQSGASGLWVATGADGKISTSPDGIAWTARTSGVAGDIWMPEDSGKSGIWIALTDPVGIRTSTDGITWTARTYPFGAEYAWDGNFSSGLWYLYATGGLVATSPDGITWTSKTTVPNVSSGTAPTNMKCTY